MKNKRIFLTLLVSLALAFTLFSVTAFANEAAPIIEDVIENETVYEAWDASIFDDIYGAVMENADKILSALAFCGTVIVGFA